MRNFFSIAVIFLATTSIATASLFGLPKKPSFSEEGHRFIVHAETGKNYQPHPIWPGAYSGVTVGIGYDCGYNSSSVILSDWEALEYEEQLAETAYIRGELARKETERLQFVYVPWKNAIKVFDRISLPRFYSLTERTFPGFDQLLPNGQAALVSLIYNRGSSLFGPRREEMREIRALVPKSDYQGMADALRRMANIWKGTPIEKGMFNRRYAEARLMESCL